MFPENTVIVLGAGASAEFGLPTGSSLFQRLLKEIPYKDKSSFSNSNNLSDYYLPSALMTTFNSYGNDMFNNEKLVEKARSTFESSIDLFSYNNSSVMRAAKFFTCWHIGASMIRSVVKPSVYHEYYESWAYRNEWLLPYFSGKRNYIAEIANKIVESSNSDSDVSKNLSVISFNYDMIFEKSLMAFLSNSERYGGNLDFYMPEIQYVYGSIPFYENVSPRLIAKDFDSIKFMMELDKEDEKIKSIREKISSAEYIYLLGFSLDPVNVELIGLNFSNAKIFSTCYDGNYETISRLIRVGCDVDVDCMVGSDSAPVTLSKAASSGLFSKHEF